MRCAMVASGTRYASAIWRVVSPPTARRVSATADDGVRDGWALAGGVGGGGRPAAGARGGRARRRRRQGRVGAEKVELERVVGGGRGPRRRLLLDTVLPPAARGVRPGRVEEAAPGHRDQPA